MSDMIYGYIGVAVMSGLVLLFCYLACSPEKLTEEQLAHKALDDDGIKVTRGGIIMVPMGRGLRLETWDAIKYLCDEWDYDYQWFEE